MSAIDELVRHTRAAAASVAGSVVSIGSDGRGSGFVVAADRVVTNVHHLRDRTTSVRFADGRVAQGTVVGTDGDGDLAVLEVVTGDAAPLTWSESTPEMGDIVLSVSRDHASASVTSGQVSSIARAFRGPRGRRIEGGIEHTAPMRRGASGGPLLALDGRVIGINTHRLDAGFYLARSGTESLRALVGKLASGESVRRPHLGVAVAPPPVTRKLRQSVGLSEVDGLLVRSVETDSPAGRAGVLVGDVLVRADGAVLEAPDLLLDALAAAGDSLALHIVRGVEQLDVIVTFGEPAPRTEA